MDENNPMDKMYDFAHEKIEVIQDLKDHIAELEAEVEEWKRSLDHAHECHEGELAELGCCRTQLTESNRRLAAMKENWELIIPFLESMTASDNINAEWRGVRDRILSGVTPDRENPRKKTKYRENCTEGEKQKPPETQKYR